MFHLLVQLLHHHKLEVLSFKNFVVKTFADTVDSILSRVNHFQCIKIFPDKIPVIFDQIDLMKVRMPVPLALVILDNTLNL